LVRKDLTGFCSETCQVWFEEDSVSIIVKNVNRLSESFREAYGTGWWQQARIYLVVIATLLITGLISPNFLTANNISNVLRQSAALGIITVGQTLVMIGGGFDLSVTAIMQLATVMMAELTRGRDALILPAFIACLLTGLLIGVANGALTARRRSAAFMVTLAMSLAITGARLWYTGATPSGSLPDGLRPLSQGQVFGVPFSLILLILLAILASVVLRRSLFGRQLYASGANPVAARLSGVRISRVWILTYTISGALAALAGLVLAAYIGYVDQWLGGGYDLDSIAAAAIGGVSLAGGRGGVWGALAGVVLIRMLMNFVLVLQLPIEYQLVVRGAVVILVVALYTLGKNRNS
jgi:ribose/xylose/arabinose/galactoside ABC-type transport system permease subunit